ncbi:lysM domain protein [Streptococcus pyogenes]|nr:lysM domain protein [Streptococcus pyogenes]
MIITKKSLFVTSVALSLAPLATAQAQEWTPRSVTEIKSELVLVDNVFTYTVKYGDTLSTIAEAMGIDVHVLGDINHIANIDLIFPDTILTANYNQHGQATTLTVQAPASSPSSVSHVPSSEPLPQASATSQPTVPMAPSATPSDVPTTPFASAKPDSSVTASSELTSSTNDVSTELSSESQKQPEVPQGAVPTIKQLNRLKSNLRQTSQKTQLQLIGLYLTRVLQKKFLLRPQHKPQQKKKKPLRQQHKKL